MILKKRVLFIVPLPPPVHGSAMMCQYINDSTLINGAFDCDFVNLSISRKMDEVGKMSLAKVWRFISSYIILICKLLSRKYDLCYLAITCYGVGFLKDAPFVLICKLFRKRIVIHQHNKGMSRYVDKSIYRWLFLWIYRNTKVILLSWLLYPDMERIVKKDQVVTCPNGIPDMSNRQVVFDRKNQVPHLLFLSNLIESKGVWILLDSCKILKEKGCQFVCDFVGGETKDITALKFEEEVEKRGLSELVVYNGRKYGKEKENYFQYADIFVSPSFNDCFPLVLLEAMQHGLPIVTTAEGAIGDMVTDNVNGLICNRKDARDLADKITFLLTDKQKKEEMGKKGYQIYKEKFTSSVFEQRMFHILSQNCK